MQFAAEDHPRVCGEKMPAVGDLVKVEGSPPRVRGKVALLISWAFVFRITPACAGKSCTAYKLGFCF